jgi:(1->4)-alpha-D-glucan 1-alpha-D-glucosylmutase
MAKGVEDTAFYCYNRLTAMCEVGGDPGRDGISVDEFHAYQAKMQATHPCTMTTLSTHDTKRADDVRARLTVLSEIPHEFADAIQRWTRRNEAKKTSGLPDRNSEYFLYQTLIGAWPIDAERTKQYMQKAMREAKQQTTWTMNNKEYENALNGFIDAILGDEEFVTDLEALVARLLVPGRVNSLAQTLWKHTAPGVPDMYQGAEVWDLSLVDPDNRRPVDYALRRKMLAEVKSAEVSAVAARLGDANDAGLPKMFVVHRCLALRREHPEWFGREAAYLPLPAQGAKSQCVVAFTRADRVLTVAPRLPLTVNGDWAGTTVEVPGGSWKNRFTGELVAGGTVPLDDLLKRFPVALLVKE